MPVHCKEFDSCSSPYHSYTPTLTLGMRMGLGDTSGAHASLYMSLNIYSKTK